MTPPNPATQQPDLPERLRTAGLRVTSTRLAVLGFVEDHPHATADSVAAAVRAELGSVSMQAVYDVLHAGTAAGLLRRIEPAGHPARFETRVADEHAHLVCRACGRTEDVDAVVDPRPCLAPPEDAGGFEVEAAEVVFWGLCPSCTHHNTNQEEAP
jgi:Fe2+ or Zn2+ uptake regulation protein